jgi:hypothetical protein
LKDQGVAGKRSVETVQIVGNRREGNEITEKIAVLMGRAPSAISLATGRGISKALRSLGADVVDVDVRNAKLNCHAMSTCSSRCTEPLAKTVGAEILEERGVAYGRGVAGSRTAFDKIHRKRNSATR